MPFWSISTRWRRLTAVAPAAAATILIANSLLAQPLAAAGAASVLVSPSTGAPGTWVTASGAGFPARRRTYITWDGSTAGMPTAMSAADGTFRTQVFVPSRASVGPHALGARAGAVTATTSFQVLVAGAAVQSTPASTPTPLPPTATPTLAATSVGATSPARLGMFYHPPQDGTTLQALVQDFASFVFTRGDEAYRDNMRAAGFGGTVLQYLMANETSGPANLVDASSPCGSYVYYPNNVSGIAGDFCSALHGEERNFLHNSTGARLYTTASWQEASATRTVYLYLMNPAAPGWQAYFAQQANENGQALGYSGLFLDNVDLTLYRGQHQEANSDGTVQEYATDSAYRSAMVDYLSAMRQQSGQTPVWANMSNPWDTADFWDPYLPYLDGFMEEYFADRWSGTYTGPSAWEAQIERAEEVLGQGKAFLGVAQGQQSDTARMRFGLASYLLIAQQNASFRYADATGSASPGYYAAWLYPEYQARLGNPTGPRYQAGSVWRRDFACGYVTVDVAATTGTIATDSTRPGCS